MAALSRINHSPTRHSSTLHAKTRLLVIHHNLLPSTRRATLPRRGLNRINSIHHNHSMPRKARNDVKKKKKIRPSFSARPFFFNERDSLAFTFFSFNLFSFFSLRSQSIKNSNIGSRSSEAQDLSVVDECASLVFPLSFVYVSLFQHLN